MTQFKKMWGLLSSLVFITQLSFGQYYQPQSRVWALGNKKGLDFSTNPPTIINTGLSSANEGSATVSNQLGQLQFCTNGTNVWNAEGNMMPNGNNINGSGLNTASTTQAAVIVPVPNDDDRYIVFSLTPVLNCRLYANIVDMRLNDGLGDVDTNFVFRKVMLRNSLTEKMTAAPGCNNDVWLLVHSNVTPSFYAYHITENGLDTNVVVSHVGNLAPASYNQGVMKVSPDGRKIMTNTFAAAGGTIGTEIYDFDPATGIVSNAQLIDVINGYGGTFSPKGTKLYIQEITVPGSIYQFDLDADDITSTKTLVGRSGQYCDMKIAPDEKIYVASNINSMGFNSYRYFARINAPDVAGSGCMFQDTVSSLPFPAATGNNGILTQGLPNDVVVARPGLQFHRLKIDSLLCNVSDFTVSVNLPYNAHSVVWSNELEGLTVELSEAGTYVAKYMNACTSYIDTFKISIGEIAEPILTRNGDDLLVTTDASIIRWYLDGQLLSNTSNQLMIERSGLYRVVVQSEVGCSDWAEFLVESELSLDQTKVEDLVIFPNPLVGNELTVMSKTGGILRVLDIQGKMLETHRLIGDEVKVDFSKWNTGIYIIEVICSETGFIQQAKVIR